MKKFTVLLFLVAILLSLNFNLVFSAESDLNNTSEEISEQIDPNEDLNEDEDFDVSSLEYDETDFEDDMSLEEYDEFLEGNGLRSVILFIFCLICIIAYIVFMKKEKEKEKKNKNNSKLVNMKSVKENNKPTNILYLIFVTFVVCLFIFCFVFAIATKNLADTFIIIILCALIYTLHVFIRNEKNLTKIIDKSIKMHKKDDAIKKANKDFVLVIVDLLLIVSSIFLILVFMFVAFSDMLEGDVLSAAIFILLSLFTAMLLRFWILIQHNNKISININQNNLKNIYKKSGVHLKFDNRDVKIKKKIKAGIKKIKKSKK